MKKKTLALLAVLLALVAAYFMFVHRWHGPDNAFQVTDPALIHKIELERVNAGKSATKLTLRRIHGDEWQVNEKYSANAVKVQDFLKTLADIRVKEPISDKAQATSLSLLKRNHLRVRIWDKAGSSLKDYLIGPTNSQQTANIFKMSFSDKCYMVAKPAVDGYVSIYYSTQELDWRDKAMWDVQGENLLHVEADYLVDSLGNAFSLRLEGEHWLLDETQITDPSRVQAYLSLFKGRVNAESFAGAAYPGMLDSLKRRNPDVTFSIETKSRQAITLHLFARPDSPSNLFGFLEGKPELLTVQHYVIDPFLKTRGYFVGGK